MSDNEKKSNQIDNEEDKKSDNDVSKKNQNSMMLCVKHFNIKNGIEISNKIINYDIDINNVLNKQNHISNMKDIDMSKIMNPLNNSNSK